MKDDFSAVLEAWDGKQTQPLLMLYQAREDAPGFYDKLVDIALQNADAQDAATWLLKHHLDQKEPLPKKASDRLLEGCAALSSWPARLHLLQMLSAMDIPSSAWSELDQWVGQCMKDENKFVRAWSYQGAYILSRYLPEGTDELREQCLLALATESASVKARVRKVMAAMDLDVAS